MVAPIITLAIAAGVVFLAYSTSTIDKKMPESSPAPAAAPAKKAPVEEEPAEESNDSEDSE
jgi:hypothetical protein